MDRRSFLAGAAIAVVIVFLTGCSSSATHELDGSVLILNENNFAITDASCSGIRDFFDLAATSPVKITPKGGDTISTDLQRGEVTQEGNCRLRFTAELPEAESYSFQVGLRAPEVRQRQMIDGSNGSSDGWWVTLGWDEN